MILYLIIIFLFYIIFKNNNIIENLSYIYPDGKKTCCLIKKEYIIDHSNPNGGDFKYIINNIKDDKCNYNLYTLNDKQQLYINDDKCKNINSLGSCRNINKECIDFVDKNFCDKYNMKWSNKTCHHQLDYVWIDPIKITLPTDYIKNNNNDKIKLFN
jgi:hypothetical protein